MLGFLSSVRAETTVALWQSDKKGAVSITFDEINDIDEELGSQFDNAFPLLQQYGLKATFFVFAWNPNENDVLELVADGQEIGSNGISNTPLSPLPDWQQHYQLSHSQEILQSLTGQEVTTFAYPFGDDWDDGGLIANVDDYYIAARTANSNILNASSPDLYI
jgi:peptidoglycan/xylan/chitin deacetylase (PgdA/CDA1 family)